MSELLEIIGEQLLGILRHPLVVFVVQAVVAYLCILWLASAFWVFRDMYRRTRDPVSPYIAAGAIVLLTPLFFALGALAYRLLRPPATLDERHAMELESDLLVRESMVDSCPACGRRVDVEWSRCPTCGLRIATDCPACGGRVGLDWTVCAWCAYDFEQGGKAAPRVRTVPTGNRIRALSRLPAVANDDTTRSTPAPTRRPSPS